THKSGSKYFPLCSAVGAGGGNRTDTPCENSILSAALANAALEAHEFAEARASLAPLVATPTRRVATLMARIEAAEHGDTGLPPEWRARAVHAAHDPAWTADGVVAETWMPVSSVTGRLDAFEWRVPVAELTPRGRLIEQTAQTEPLILGAAATKIAAPAT